MKQKTRCCTAAAVLCVLAMFLSGCGQKDESLPPRQTRTTVLVPECAQEVVYGNGAAGLDASRTGEGYLMVRYSGQSSKVKVQVTNPDSTVYTYSLTGDDYVTLPLTGGSGTYCVDVLENAYDDFYAVVFTQQLSVEISDPFSPFLYPNQYVWYTPESKVYELGKELSDQSVSDLDYVEQVYEYIIGHIVYDQELAETVRPGYLPDVDRTLATNKGICFDYASLMAALLRTQGIPTKLVVGYSGQQYHAWIDVYLEDQGWVSHVIYFDGSSWSLMDPTLGASNGKLEVKQYVGDGSHYLAKYQY